ncbi:glycosyl hydrolase family 65 protein [Herbaspirillum sp. ST 5-3]|uniref:glycoside hydrolase family 65 protein n=1 Tax=Oxalobacteraceae TaxID=75682 RepID=UPI0010A4AA5D|nr:glycosyl hydrolase family 65 protein [Herbaspirillum sp. ST 5-3]
MNEDTMMDSSECLSSPFAPTTDPLWLMIDDEFTPTREHEFEALFSVANGYLGSRGSLPFGTSLSAPMVFIAGVFDLVPPSTLPEMVAAPGWTLLSQATGPNRLATESLALLGHRRMLDMRQGIFRREFRFSDKEGRVIHVRFLRLASLADRHILLQSSLCTAETYSGPLAIRSGFVQSPGSATQTFSSSTTCRESPSGPVQILAGRTHAGTTIALAVAARLNAATASEHAPRINISSTAGAMDNVMQMEVEAGKAYQYDWLEACHTSRDNPHPEQAAVAQLERLLAEGVTPAIRRHVEAWARRWQAADVEIEGDVEAQRAIRFACYHLISAVNPADERVSIGARGLSGSGYKGHVFWDTEIFLLPFYTLTDPPCARALLMYRFHTLAAARDKARRLGYTGALYAWESADSGEDVTPPYAITPVGEVLPVVTGLQAHHISADIAYAVWQYWQATGDDDFLCNAGAEILVETARFWAGRGEIEGDGRYHIRKVIGPDEYHDEVDDNAYTNWMAQWNLDCACTTVGMMKERWPQPWRDLAGRIGFDDRELERWRSVSAAMYTGMDAERNLIEQFQGYFELEDIDPAQYAPRSLPLDIILGRERTRRSKLVKQADVVMLLHLFGERIPPAMLEASFRYYEPRTEHGSSLSPAMHALIAAQIGDMDMALRYFRQAREIDLADNMGNASGGVHMAALGGLWQALVFGFAGLRTNETGLALRPNCPPAWRAVRLKLLWRGRQLALRIGPVQLEIELLNGTSIPVTVGNAPAVLLDAGRTSRWEWTDGTWKELASEYR